MLRFIVEQIKSVFKEGEIIGRVGGDEFVVFAGNLEGTDAIIRKAELYIKLWTQHMKRKKI